MTFLDSRWLLCWLHKVLLHLYCAGGSLLHASTATRCVECESD